MKHKFKAKISIVLIAASIAAETSVLSASAKYNESTITQGETLMPTIQTYWKYGEMYKYQAGRYWNDLEPDNQPAIHLATIMMSLKKATKAYIVKDTSADMSLVKDIHR